MKTPSFLLVGAVALVITGCGSGAGVKSADEAYSAPAPVQAPADAPVLAVTGIQAQNTEKADAAMVTDIIRAELMALGKWRVIDREHMDEILKGKVLAMAGVTSDSEAVTVGKLLNAQLMGVGTFGKLMGTSNVVTFRIVDVETGLAKYAGTAQGDTLAALRKDITRMVRGFAR